MSTLGWRDRITLGAGALLLVGAVLLVVALAISALTPALVGGAAAATGYGVISTQRRAGSARRR